MLVEFGSGRIIEVSRQPLKGGGWVSLHEDITERRRQEEKIAHLARHDTLTGLANRMLFRERLEQSLQRLVRGQGFAVLCLDLDHFKAVNDTLGHPVGDLLLKQVGKRLLGCVRHGDIVARLGGDEFAIVQASVRDPGQTESLAARIVETVSAPYEIDGNRIDIGTSIGITLAPRDGTDADKLMKNADLALYRTKDAGRRGFSFFEPEMHEEIQARRKPRSRPAQGARRGRAGAVTTSPSSASSRSRPRGSRRCCAGTIPSAARFRPASFSPSPRTSA